jgi:DNA-binding NtrC family response regulator
MRKKTCSGLPPESVIFGRSREMLRLQQDLKRASAASLPILLKGEKGVGKNLISRFIHCTFSPDGSYLHCSCPDMSTVTIESVHTALAGPCNEDGNDGQHASETIATVFLDEVAELTPELQIQVLHSLPEPDGFGTGHPLRIISSTAKDLRRLLKRGMFRKELFYRLAVVTLEVPPLRRRLQDLSLIASYLRDYYSRSLGVIAQPFTTELMERMRDYDWPGNILELKSFIWRYVMFGSTELSGACLEAELN